MTQPGFEPRKRTLRLLWAVGALATLTTAIAQAPPAASAPPAPASAVAGTAAVSTDKFALADGALRLPFGASSGEVTFILSADALAKEAMAATDFAITDLAKAAPAQRGTVSFRVDGELPPSAAGRRWLVTAKAGELGVNDELPRYAELQLGGLKRVVPYLLTNRVRTPPDFTLNLNSPWRLTGKDDANTLTVVTGDQALTGLRLANALLTEKTLGDALRTQQFELCRSAQGPCDPPGTLAALATHTLYLQIKDGARANGRFSGTLAFAVSARPDAKSVPLELLSTSGLSQLWGSIVIAAGVGLAFWLSQWSRNRLNRLAALRPALEARRRILDLLDRLDAAGRVTGVLHPLLKARYDAAAQSLSEQQLDRDGMLPERLPGTQAPALGDLKARLAALEQPIAGLTLVVSEGVEPWTLLFRTATPGDQAHLKAGLALLDAPDETATLDKARALIAKAHQVAFPPNDAALGSPRAKPADKAALEVQQVLAQIDALNTRLWLAYLLLAALIGSVSLVWGNPGFGTWMDYVYCLLWGFGLPTTLDKLQQASPATVSTALGITLPK